MTAESNVYCNVVMNLDNFFEGFHYFMFVDLKDHLKGVTFGGSFYHFDLVNPIKFWVILFIGWFRRIETEAMFNGSWYTVKYHAFIIGDALNDYKISILFKKFISFS